MRPMTAVERTREPAGSQESEGSPEIAGSQESEGSPGRGRPGRRRRRPAPHAHFFWRFAYPAVVAAAGLAVFLLAREGGRAVLDQKAVPVDQPVVLQPDEPGYLAFVGATPTLLALHTHNGELAGVTFMARTGIDAGGGIVLLPPDLLAVPPGGNGEEGEFLSSVYAQGGADAVERLAETMFGLGFDEVIEVSSEALAGAMKPAEPLPYLLVDNLVEVGPDGVARVVYEAGRIELPAVDAAVVYAFLNPDEADVNRAERQRAMWESWLGAIGRAEDPDTVVLPFEAGLSPYLRAFSAGTTVVEVAPLQSVVLEAGARPFYLLGDEGLRDRSLELVPWPMQPESFLRPRVQMLDGTGDPSVRDALAADVIAAGGVVTVIGNAPEFGVEATQFAYHRPELVTDPITNSIAVQLGVDMALVELGEGTPGVVDITVTVGQDQALP